MQEAIPLCLDQNTSELQQRPLCIHLQNVLYNIFLSRMPFECFCISMEMLRIHYSE